MLNRLLIICALSLIIPLNANARLIFGTVPDENALIRTESQAHRVGAYLQTKLGEEVKVRLFEDETVLHTWLNRYQQVDFALLSKSYFNEQPRGEFFVAEGANHRSQFVLRQGLTLRDRLHLEKNLALLATDPVARTILQPPPPPKKVAPSPVAKPVVIPKVTDKKAAAPTIAKPAPVKTVASPPSLQETSPSVPEAAPKQAKIWIDPPQPEPQQEKAANPQAPSVSPPKAVKPFKAAAPEIKKSSLTPMIFLALTGLLAAFALLRRNSRQKAETRVWPQDLINPYTSPQKTASVKPKSYFSAPSPVSRRAAPEPAEKQLETESSAEDEIPEADDSSGKERIFLVNSSPEDTDLSNESKADCVSAIGPLSTEESAAGDSPAINQLPAEEEEGLHDQIYQSTTKAAFDGELDTAGAKDESEESAKTDQIAAVEAPTQAEMTLGEDSHFEKAQDEPAFHIKEADKVFKLEPAASLENPFDDAGETTDKEAAVEGNPFDQAEIEPACFSPELATVADEDETPSIAPSFPLTAAIDDLGESSDEEAAAEDNPLEHSESETPFSSLEPTAVADNDEDDASPVVPSVPLIAAIDDLGVSAGEEAAAEDKLFGQFETARSFTSLEPEAIAEDGEGTTCPIEPSVQLAAAIDDLGELPDEEAAAEDNPFEQSEIEPPFSGFEPEATAGDDEDKTCPIEPSVQLAAVIEELDERPDEEADPEDNPFAQHLPEPPLTDDCETDEPVTADVVPPFLEPSSSIVPESEGTEDRQIPIGPTSLWESEDPFDSPPPAHSALPGGEEEGLVALEDVNPFDDAPEEKENTADVQQSIAEEGSGDGSFFSWENADGAPPDDSQATAQAVSAAGGHPLLEERGEPEPILDEVKSAALPEQTRPSGMPPKQGTAPSLRIKGVLIAGQVPALLKLISGQNQPGVLKVTNSLGVKRVFFNKGKISTASSTSPKADHRDKSFLLNKLGYLLVRQGKISEEARDHALEICARDPSKRLGETLIETCNLTREDLTNALRIQVEEVLYSLLLFSMGKFEFKPEKNPVSDCEDLEISVSDILQGAARQADEWKNIRKTIPSLKAVIAFESNGKLKLQHAKMTAAQNYVLSMIDGTKSVRDICITATMLEIEVYKFISLLVKAKILKLVA